MLFHFSFHVSLSFSPLYRMHFFWLCSGIIKEFTHCLFAFGIYTFVTTFLYSDCVVLFLEFLFEVVLFKLLLSGETENQEAS